MVKSFSAGVSYFQCFSGLSGGPWQARKYSVRRDGCDLTQAGMIIGGNRIRAEGHSCRAPRKRGTQSAAAPPVIASAAKQSIAPHAETWIASSQALPCANASRL